VGVSKADNKHFYFIAFSKRSSLQSVCNADARMNVVCGLSRGTARMSSRGCGSRSPRGRRLELNNALVSLQSYCNCNIGIPSLMLSADVCRDEPTSACACSWS
jgi:hypothetical protein